MEKLRKEQLTGFRNPYLDEKKILQKFLLRDFKSMQKLMRWGSALLAVFLVSMAMAVMEDIKKASFDGETIVNVVLTALLLWGFLLLHERRIRNKILIAKAKQGDFQVLDCIAYEISTSTDKADTGVVCICTKDGQYCWDRFRVDLDTVRIYQQGGKVPLLLVKCQIPGKKMDYFELFTENRLQTGRKQ